MNILYNDSEFSGEITAILSLNLLPSQLHSVLSLVRFSHAESL